MINIIREIVKLTPQKGLIYCLLIAITWLSVKLKESIERGDGQTSKQEFKLEKALSEKDSLQHLRLVDKQNCDDVIESKDLEMKDLLKQIIEEQKQVKSRVSRVEKSADKVITQTKTKLNPM